MAENDIFDLDEDVFDEEEDALEGESREDSSYPLTTRAEEEMVSALPGTPYPAPARQLVAFFGADGQPLVAYSVNGQMQEQPRPPTQEELELLRVKGRLVQGGIENAPAMGAAPAAQGSFLSRNATLLGGLAAVAVGASVYFYQKRKREREEAETEEVDMLSPDLADSASAVEL